MDTLTGCFIKQIRINELKQTLRSFSVDNGYQPSFISRLERGEYIFPPNMATVLRMSDALGIDGNRERFSQFVDCVRFDNYAVIDKQLEYLKKS